MDIPRSTLAIAIILFVTTTLPAQNIFRAVQKGDLAEVKEYVEKDPRSVKLKATGPGWHLSTPLHLAAQADNAVIAAYLIEKGADINAVRDDYQSPLFMAGINVTKLLVEKGADINYITPEGHTAISLAVEKEDRQVFDYLLDKGANLPEPGSYGAECSIEFGLKGGSVKCLEKYLQEGLSIHYVNSVKMTLAHFAALCDSTGLMNRLIELGAPVRSANVFGWIPLHMAAYNGNLAVVQLLVQKGSDKDALTIDGKTPCLLAVEEKKTRVSDYLIAHGACQTASKPVVLSGEYFGQKLRGKAPEPFVPPLPGIQKGLHGIYTFSPDGKEAFWKTSWDPNTAIIESKRINGQWTAPIIASFSAEIQGDDAPFISPDGKKLYFLSQRPVTTREIPYPYVEKIWVMDKTPDGWSAPEKLPEIINSVEGMHWQLSTDNQNNLYFGAGGFIYRAEYNNGTFNKPEKLDSTINRKPGNFSPFIAPDGSYLIFSRQVPYYTYQLFISYKKRDGTWTEPTNLSNYLKYEYSLNPRVTVDGKYFFFTGRWGITFWTDASFIEELKPG